MKFKNITMAIFVLLVAGQSGAADALTEQELEKTEKFGEKAAKKLLKIMCGKGLTSREQCLQELENL